MPISISYPGDHCNAMDESLKALVERSISSTNNVRSVMRSVSLKCRRDANPSTLKTLQSGQSMIKGSLSFNSRRQMQPFHFRTTISVASPDIDEDRHKSSHEHKISRSSILLKKSLQSPIDGPGSPKHEAAVKLQKVYKSFRTRRQLADCAVIVEQQWWKLIDFALLKRSSVSFFDIERQESAVSRWARARTRAAKVGKGLSKDEKARKLALQHWLEAIDPRHRYGHNLQFYYDRWLQCESRQPFFYWLDVGEGKEINLEGQCTRLKLQQQCITYFGPKEREAYEVIVKDGKFIYKQSMQLLDTCESPKDTKWIFVLSTSKILYVGQKKKGTFQHSSFLAGGATSAAGRLVVENGILKAVWPHSGHYRPTEENFQEFMSFLQENGVDLTDVKRSPTEGDEDLCSGHSSRYCDLKLADDISIDPQTKETSNNMTTEASSSLEAQSGVNLSCCSTTDPRVAESKSISSDGADTSNSEQNCSPSKQSLSDEEEQKDEETFVPSELILRRIDSKKGMKSFQLGKKLSFKWAAGTGPRIACVRDYPSELQFRALEQVNLSPRSAGNSRFASPRTTTTSSSLSSTPGMQEACSVSEGCCRKWSSLSS